MVHIYGKPIQLGRYLAKRRKALALSQCQVAIEMGYSSSQFISNVERGLCQPPLQLLAKLVQLYKIDKQEIIELLVDQYKRQLTRQL